MIVLKSLGERMEYYAPSLLRMGLALVYLWFGISQIMSPLLFTQYIPDFLTALLDNSELIVLSSGIIVSLLGLLLLLGLMTKIVAWILVFHMIIVLNGIGYNSMGVKSFGILIGTITIAMTRNDSLRLDNKIKFGKKKDVISFD